MRRFLDLFSGIGGFALGAYWAGWRFDGHYFSEIDPYAVRVYQKHFPEAISLGDIKNVRGECLPKGEWIISGGFPCQDISICGKNAGLDGGRSGLWFEYARLIYELRPEYAIIENVGALAFRGLDRTLCSLAEIGYDAVWQDIRASDMGAPHKRERLWIVAYPKGKRWGLVQANKIQTRKKSGGKEHSEWDDVQFKTAGNYSVELQKGNESFVCGMDDGLPDWLDRLKCCGNAIVPQIAELIFRSIADAEGW